MVLWSDSSKKKLDRIFWYYEITAGKKVAKKIVQGILLSSKKLETFPFKGQVENLIKSVFEYRYLVFGNYKIIYSVFEKDLIVKVVDVFDCCQNPEKLK